MFRTMEAELLPRMWVLLPLLGYYERNGTDCLATGDLM